MKVFKLVENPIVIEMVLVEFDANTQQEIVDWCNGTKAMDGGVWVPGRSKIMIANTGTYIAKCYNHVDGEYFDIINPTNTWDEEGNINTLPKTDEYQEDYPLENVLPEATEEENKERFGENKEKEDGTFMDRLLKEKEELGNKINGLSGFLNSPASNTIDQTQVTLLNIQVKAMETYSQCLLERIVRLLPPETKGVLRDTSVRIETV